MTSAIGAVTGSSAEAVAAGGQVLRAGGNAVDAAVAAALASCVADPCNTGIGGYGGHMIVAPAGQAPVCIDFNLWAPLAATKSYRRALPRGPAASVIPNVVAGLSAALAAFGTMPWAEVMQPAVALADDGFMANTTLARALAEVAGAPFVDQCFSIERDASGNSGLRIRQPALAATLRQLAANGPQWFYEGPIATLASRCLRDAGHEITPAHWAEALKAVTVAPAPVLRLRDSAFFSSPPGTSGSICMFATVAAGAEIGADLELPAGIRRCAERMAAAWSYRFNSPGANTIADDEIADWVARAAACKPAATTGAADGHTCHLNAADSDGMLVAATLTHGKLWFGARWVLPDTGVIMNYGGPMVCDPEPKIAGERAYGVTNMSPTIARRDGGAAVAIGAPGARRIASIIGIALARHIFGRIPLQEAIVRGRFHAEARDRATLEKDRFPPEVASALQAAFRTVETEGPADYYGPCTAIRRDGDGGLALGMDDRWQGFGAILC